MNHHIFTSMRLIRNTSLHVSGFGCLIVLSIEVLPESLVIALTPEYFFKNTNLSFIITGYFHYSKPRLLKHNHSTTSKPLPTLRSIFSMASSSQNPAAEFCGTKEHTLHQKTVDTVFRCCGEKVPSHLKIIIPATAISSSITYKKITGKGKRKGKNIITPPETISLLSSPLGSPILMIEKAGQSLSNRGIVEAARQTSIKQCQIERKIKEEGSKYGLANPPALVIPAAKTSTIKRIAPRDSRKIMIYVGSSSDNWPAFKCLGKIIKHIHPS